MGRPLLDCGRPSHYRSQFLRAALRSEADAIEKYFGEWSSYKVNTVLVDRRSQVRDGPPATAPLVEPMPDRWHASTLFDYLEGHYDLGYEIPVKPVEFIEGLMHHPQVMHLRGLGCWWLVDSMQSRAATPWPYTQTCKLPPYLVLTDRGGLGVNGFT